MQKFLDGVKDFLYDSIDYIIMIGIIGLVVFIIGWRLDLLFAKDVDDIIPNENIIVEKEQDENKSPNLIIEDDEKNELEDEEEETTESIVEDNPEEDSEEPDKPKDTVEDNTNNTTITVSIPAGANLSNISSILESNGLISSKSDFINKSEDMQLATKLKAGNFKIKSGSSMEEIIKVLTK